MEKGFWIKKRERKKLERLKRLRFKRKRYRIFDVNVIRESKDEKENIEMRKIEIEN